MTASDLRISDWRSVVCSSDLVKACACHARTVGIGIASGVQRPVGMDASVPASRDCKIAAAKRADAHEALKNRHVIKNTLIIQAARGIRSVERREGKEWVSTRR